MVRFSALVNSREATINFFSSPTPYFNTERQETGELPISPSPHLTIHSPIPLLLPKQLIRNHFKHNARGWQVSSSEFSDIGFDTFGVQFAARS